MNVGVWSTMPCERMMARMASVLARHRCSSARTKPLWPVARSFHHPFCPENDAATKISLTGV
jgi:hypothetical protein